MVQAGEGDSICLLGQGVTCIVQAVEGDSIRLLGKGASRARQGRQAGVLQAAQVGSAISERYRLAERGESA